VEKVKIPLVLVWEIQNPLRRAYFNREGRSNWLSSGIDLGRPGPAKFDKFVVGVIPTSEVAGRFSVKGSIQVGGGAMGENIVVGERKAVRQAKL